MSNRWGVIMKFLKVFLIIWMIISAVLCIFSIKDCITKREWQPAKAEITFVGLPDGAVIGTYTDSKGTIHTEEMLYIDFLHQSYKARVDDLIGKTVNIVYDEKTGKTDIDRKREYFISAASFILSFLSVIIIYKKRKENKIL